MYQVWNRNKVWSAQSQCLLLSPPPLGTRQKVWDSPALSPWNLEWLLWNMGSTMADPEEKNNPSYKKFKYVFPARPARACTMLLLRVLNCTCQSPEVILHLQEQQFENNGLQCSLLNSKDQLIQSISWFAHCHLKGKTRKIPHPS